MNDQELSVQNSALPEQLPVGIVHLGLGAFHRAHQALYTEEAIVQAGGGWGICAVSMRNQKLVETMQRQECRYTLIEQSCPSPALRELSVIREVLCLADSPEHVLMRLADPQVHIVTITVTEKGYLVGAVGAPEGPLNMDDSAIVRDLQHPQQPSTLVGTLVYGLQRRRLANRGGLTLISCDNLSANGHLLKSIVLQFAGSIEKSLVDWIESHCRFPDTMVDRITPAPDDSTLALTAQLLPQPDPCAVEAEPFRQWVIEDSFAGPRPAWEQVGAQLVDDVAPYEAMKLRMLNGAHSLIAYLGAVTGLDFVRQVMAEPVYRQLVDLHMQSAVQTVSGIEPTVLAQYRIALLQRFDNPAIDHRCLQIATDGSQKLPQRILTPALELMHIAQPDLLDPTDREQLNSKVTSTYALTVALWIQHLLGVNEAGDPIDSQDPHLQEFRAIIADTDHGEELVRRLMSFKGFPQILLEHTHWMTLIADYLAALSTDGARTVISNVLAQACLSPEH